MLNMYSDPSSNINTRCHKCVCLTAFTTSGVYTSCNTNWPTDYIPL